MLENYNINWSELFKSVKEHPCKHVVIQVPEGLKNKAIALCSFIEKNVNKRVYIWGETVFGACDALPKNEEKLILHFGHSSMDNGTNPLYRNVIYVEMRRKPKSALEIETDLTQNIRELPQNLGLCATIQDIDYIPLVKSILERNGKKIYIGEKDSRITYSGQVLGCDLYTAHVIREKVEGYIFIGNGTFHALGIALSTNKPVYIYNPQTGEIQDIANLKGSILKERYTAITLAKEAKTFGIIVGTKPGQNRLEHAERLKKLLEKNNKVALIFYFDRVAPEELYGYSVDCWINTACPRIAIDDYRKFDKVMITPIEAVILLGIRDMENYLFDEIRTPLY